MKKLLILFLVFAPFGAFAQGSPVVYNVKNDQINDTYADAGTAFTEDNKLLFSSPNEGLKYNKEDDSNRTFLDPDMTEVIEDEDFIIEENVLDDPSLNLEDAMVSFSKDRKTVFFSVNSKIKNKKEKNEEVVKIKSAVHLQLFKANVNEKGEWVNLEMLPFNSNHFSTGQPVLNQDDTKLYFVSDGPESLGRTDIFVVDINKDGTYGTPVNLGPEINSAEREIFPFINTDNVMFFSSDLYNRQGELDVFVCKIFENTISTPIKLNVPEIGEKDTEPIVSVKRVGKGAEDIYAFAASIPVDFECQQEISGFVKNSETQELLPNVEIVLYDDNNKKLQSFLSGESDGSFSFKQSCNTSYTLKGYLDGYLTGELDIKTVNDLHAEPIEIVMHMSADPGVQEDQLADTSEVKDPGESLPIISAVETAVVEPSNEDTEPRSNYNFNSDAKVYTVQIGAFKGNALTDKYLNVTGLFNHLYDDGFNRYYSGVFESSLEAENYRNLMKNEGYHDAFVVGLKGEKRF